MTLDFFVKNYNFSDLDIKKAYIKANKLYIKAMYNVYLELIANGYRPEMNMDVEKTFVFGTEYNDHQFKSKIIEVLSYKDNELMIKIDNITLKIIGNVITE